MNLHRVVSSRIASRSLARLVLKKDIQTYTGNGPKLASDKLAPSTPSPKVDINNVDAGRLLSYVLLTASRKDEIPNIQYSNEPNSITSSFYTPNPNVKSYYGTNRFVEYIPGNSPIVLAAPHGGFLMPENVADRPSLPGVRLLNDLNTHEIAKDLTERLGLYGKRPHLIVCHLNRRKVDVNRDIHEYPFSSSEAAHTWLEYHRLVEIATKQVERSFGRGLYIDLHGQKHPEKWIELGYLVHASDLDRLNEHSASGTVSQSSSLRGLSGRRNHFLDLIRGPNSLGGLFERKAYKTVPSPSIPSPNGGQYYRGGYCLQRHTSLSIDGVQIELPAHLRRGSMEIRNKLVNDMADIINHFVSRHYPMTGQEVENFALRSHYPLPLSREYPNELYV
ncbi:hypothetical protein K493DRAFT_409435 [Basidiobolus meristosporus CBS 931.73]|uniref:N-formylglutamate amidohydrolase n=1 Tax=Basidiobolus meristosporus CBS 931.73 TaxID=1314790 RepID=A0A1Y1XZR9_9FUNG|nr:hypothetical protein K493DRAFT_409435 [Basidiobolus meristosporus CBS 931.73]|eukprot:ORX91229.1 hypothetical protein K493DRAFT_409435 [Basidiobolus meristosporus CBS 931.73]